MRAVTEGRPMSHNSCVGRVAFLCGSAGSLSRAGCGFRKRGSLLASCALAMAALATSALPGLAGCNSGPSAQNYLLSSVDCQAYATGQFTVAVGLWAVASAEGSTAFGHDAYTDNRFATAVGFKSGTWPKNSGIGSTAIGAHAGRSATGVWSVAIGAGVQTDHAPHAFGAFGVAIGGGDNADRLGARASGHASVAVGHRSVAGGEGFASAFGYNARAGVGLAPTAIGTDSNARGTNAAAFGRFSSATAESSTALGSGAQARRKGSVAIGYSSIADEANIVSVGSTDIRRRITNVANAQNPTDAVPLRQVKQMIAAATAAGAPLAAERPAVSVVAVDQEKGGAAVEDLRRRLSALESLVRLQQERIAQLEGRAVAAAPSAR